MEFKVYVEELCRGIFSRENISGERGRSFWVERFQAGMILKVAANAQTDLFGKCPRLSDRCVLQVIGILTRTDREMSGGCARQLGETGGHLKFGYL